MWYIGSENKGPQQRWAPIYHWYKNMKTLAPSEHVSLGDLVQTMDMQERVGIVLEIELNKSMGYSVSTEEVLYCNHARIMWFGPPMYDGAPKQSWRMFRELRVLSSGSKKSD